MLLFTIPAAIRVGALIEDDRGHNFYYSVDYVPFPDRLINQQYHEQEHNHRTIDGRNVSFVSE